MRNKGTAIIHVCHPEKVKHLQTIDLEVTVSYGAKSFLASLSREEAIAIATEIMIEVNRRHLV